MNKVRKFGSKKGSSSVLVIMIMLALVMFGTLAMTSALSDLKLAEKSVHWLGVYYQLDAKGETFLSSISQNLGMIKTTTEKYFTDKKYLLADSTTISAKIQTAIRSSAIASNIENDPAARANLYRKVYSYFLYEYLKGVSADSESTLDFLNDVSIYAPDRQIPETGIFTVTTAQKITVENEQQSLDIKLEIICPNGDGSDPMAYYKILEWNQTQKQFDYNSGLVIWDGKVGK